jgi:hypothetical protein
MGMSERRKDSRYLCADLVHVEWLQGRDDNEEFRYEEGILEDISRQGGCVQLEHPIPLGSTIVLSIHEEKFTGHVSYCFYRDFGYFIGIHFSDDKIWSVDKVAPDHLTNLRTLAGRRMKRQAEPEVAPSSGLTSTSAS